MRATKYFNILILLIYFAFLSSCNTNSDQVQKDSSTHTDDQVDEKGRSFHVHADGTIHYSELSETKVTGNLIQIPEKEIETFGIGVGTAEPGQLEIKITLQGEIAINTDNMAHIVPRVPGIVRQVNAKLGDKVKKGEIMAVIDSRELADAKADYLAGLERFDLAQTIFNRKEKLWKDDISSEQEYLSSKQNLAGARINLRSAKQKLIAMGFSSSYLETLPDEPDDMFTDYNIVAPFDGTVINKHIALGEDLKDDAEVFIIADLSAIWINLQVYPDDIPLIKKGQPVCLMDQVCVPETHGVIDYVGPVVSTKTRTAIARVVQSNPTGELRPGLFVSANVTVKTIKADVVINKEHIQYLNDIPCVFVKVQNGFELRGVTPGDTDGKNVSITAGLSAGEIYAATNGFLLKSEMEKSARGFHVHADGTVHMDDEKH